MKVYEDGLAEGGGGMSILPLPNVIASAGGFPLIEAGKIVGAIGVSGSPTGTIDEQAAQAMVDTLKKVFPLSGWLRLPPNND